MIDKGCTFIWCSEACVYEVVPRSRCRRTYLLKRALLRGSNFSKHPAHRGRNLVRSLIAVPAYLLVLPMFLIYSRQLGLRYTIKLLDHASRLLSFAGFPLVRRRET